MFCEPQAIGRLKVDQEEDKLISGGSSVRGVVNMSDAVAAQEGGLSRNRYVSGANI